MTSFSLALSIGVCKDTVVGSGEVLIEDPVDDVLYVSPQGVTHTGVHVVFIHHIMGHVCTLQKGNNFYILSRLDFSLIQCLIVKHTLTLSVP